MLAEDRQMIKKLIVLAVPAIIDYALQSAVNYADYIMVGSLGQNASAAIGLTTEVNFLLRGILTALGIGIVSYIAVSVGKGELGNIRRASTQSFYLAGAAGIFLLCLTMLIAPFLPVWMGADISLRKPGSDYFRIIHLGAVGMAFNTLFGSVLKGIGNMKTPMYVNTGMNLMNIFLNFLLIYDCRTVIIGESGILVWGAGLGLNGAAWSTAIANMVGGLCMIVAVWKNPVTAPWKENFRLEISVIKRIVLVAYPAFLCRVVTSMGRILFTVFVAGLGTTAFAAHTITFTAESAFYMPVVGAQTAVTTLAGNAKGEGNRKKLSSLVKYSCLLIGELMAAVAVIMILCAGNVLSFFSSDQDVIHIGVILFYIVAVNEPLFGISVIMEGIFNGIGDTKKTFRISAATLWCIRVLGTWVAIHVLHAGVYGAWICMVMENACRGLALLISYYRRGKSLIGSSFAIEKLSGL